MFCSAKAKCHRAPAARWTLWRRLSAKDSRSRPPVEHKQKRRRKPAAFCILQVRVLALHETGELLVEAGEPAAAVHQLLLAAGPGRVSAGVDVQSDLLARRAIGG